MEPILNPTLHGGEGFIITPLQHFGSGAFQIDTRDPIFWYNSYLMLRIYDLDLWSPKGVQIKFRA